MVAPASRRECLTEDELLGLAAGTLGAAPDAEAHVGGCATCSALLAGLVRGAPARAWNELAGSQLGPYRLDAQIGAGGMGAVYRAWDARLGRAIAVKVLHDGGAVAAEARAAAAIDHRGVVGIYDVGEVDGLHYVAMELVEGEALRSALARGGLGVARAHQLACDLVDALVAAHARGVTHRDLKPENLVLARGGLRVLDFGLAAVEGDGDAGGGTAGYMAPEQARGEPADARSDLFAVGAIAYELATGERAFPGATRAERLAATLRGAAGLSLAPLGELAPIVERCLAPAPRDRFQTAADLAWALRAKAAPAPPRRLSRRALLGGGLGAIAAAALGYAIGRRRPAAGLTFAVRSLTHRTGRVYTARFTRDGSRALYGAAWASEPVAIHEIDFASGETTLPALASGDVLAVSARGELAACFGLRYVDHQSARGALALVTLAGGSSRPLADDVQDADFVPGGDALAVVRPSARGYRLEVPIGATLVDEPGWITHVRVAPAGGQLAYLRHPHSNDDGGELVLADLTTRTTRVLASGWTSLAGLAWAPTGDALWFTASREDLGNRLHVCTLAGEVTPVPGPTADRLRIHDLATDGRALVTLDSWRLRAMAGERDVSLSEVSYVSDLSRDGETVLIGELGDIESGIGTHLVPYGGGPLLRLGSGFPVAISPSGERVAANVNAADHLVVYSTRSGEAPIIAAPGFVTFGRWLDEAALLAVFDKALWRLAIGAAPSRLAPTAGSFALDPARARCAYLDPAHALQILDLATGASRAVPVPLARAEEVCGWLAARDAIVVRSTTTPLVLDRIDPVTGARTRHLEVQPPKLGLKAVDSFVLHADGARYAYSYGQELSQLVILTPQV